MALTVGQSSACERSFPLVLCHMVHNLRMRMYLAFISDRALRAERGNPALQCIANIIMDLLLNP